MSDSKEALKDKLRELNELYEQGLIDKDDLNKRKEPIVDALTGTKGPVSAPIVKIKDEITKLEIPEATLALIHNPVDVLLFTRGESTQYYVGSLAVFQHVYSWVQSLHIATQAKRVFIVDGKVKSGKTTVARHVVPYYASSFPRFANACAVYVDLLTLSEARTNEDKERGFCELVQAAFKRAGSSISGCTTIIELKEQLFEFSRKKMVFIVTLDEYHFMYNNLDDAQRRALALQVRNLLLDNDSSIYFVVTASTQPLLWTSLNFSLTNGISLLGSPTIYTTPNSSPDYMIFSTILLFDYTIQTSFKHRGLHSQSTCAVQAQVLQALATGCTETQAEQTVYKSKALTYQRDLNYFYESNQEAMASLLLLAHGTPTLPGLHSTYGVLHVPHWVEKRRGLYYLKDWELAAVLVNTASGRSMCAECIFLWPLIPIARNVEEAQLFIPDNHFSEFTHIDGNWNHFWGFVLGHSANKEAAATHPLPTWNSLFRLARNIYCHEGDADASQVVALYCEFKTYFGSARSVHGVLSKALDFYQA